MANCQCKVCKDHRRWVDAFSPLGPRAEKALDEILSRLEAAETDRVYWRMKFDGTWGNPECPWYKAEGNERYMFFTACGAQIEYDVSWWKHCPKCGDPIARPAETQKEGQP